MVSDKEHHGLFATYAEWFEPKKAEPINFLELGVCDGDSLNWFSEYFTHPDTIIHGIDIVKPTISLRPNVLFEQTDQTNKDMFAGKEFDIILDDASHTYTNTMNSFYNLWPRLKKGGYYVIEDWHPKILPDMREAVKRLQYEYYDEITTTKEFVKDTEEVAATILFQKK